VAGQRNHYRAGEFNCYPRGNKQRLAGTPLSKVQPPAEPYENSGGQSAQHVVKQQPFQAVSLELPLPRGKSGDHGGKSGQSGERQIVVCGLDPVGLL